MRPASLAAVVAITAIAHAERTPPATALPVEQLRLGNGLDVVLAPDPLASSVVVHVRFEAGIASEPAEQAGYTRLVELLMFTGSVHVKRHDYDAQVERAGGFTGSVSAGDHLSVFEQVPPGALELALWLEAERMAGLADGITEAGLAEARDAFAAEARSAYGRLPYALVTREVQHALWPTGHRYHHGALADGDATRVTGATRDSVRSFVRERIRPGNATLVIAGAFELATARELAQRYFGWIPDSRRARAGADDVTPLAAPVDADVADPVDKVVVAYRLPPPGHPDSLPLEVAARLLAGSRGTWLHHVLVDSELASEVTAEVVAQRHGGELRITAITPRGAARHAGAKLVDTIAVLGTHTLPAHDVARAVASFETTLLLALEALPYRAAALARWHAHDDARYLEQLPARLRSLTAPRIRAAAARWLAPTAAVIVTGEARRL